MPTTRFWIKVRPMIVMGLLWATASYANAIPLTASVDQREGLPRLSIGGGNAMSSQFLFWGRNGTLAQLTNQFEVIAPFEYMVFGEDQALNFDLSALIAKSSNQQLVWTIDLDAAKTRTDVIGAGISFAFDIADFEPQLGKPTLLPDNRGWSWGDPTAPRWNCASIRHWRQCTSKMSKNRQYEHCSTKMRCREVGNTL